jgi:hypothetical protein
MKHGPNIWVVCRGGRYTVKEEGRKAPLTTSSTQHAAIRIGRLLARANRCELITQARDGRIRAKDSHGFDSFPPRG